MFRTAQGARVLNAHVRRFCMGAGMGSDSMMGGGSAAGGGMKLYAGQTMNKVELIGNLGTDPNTVELSNGTFVTELNLATKETWKNKTTGEWTGRTEWHNVKIYSQLPELPYTKLLKGDKVYVAGKINKRRFGDNDEKLAVDIVCRGGPTDVFLLSRPEQRMGRDEDSFGGPENYTFN